MKWTLVGAGALAVIALAGVLLSTTRVGRSPAAAHRFRPAVVERRQPTDGDGLLPRPAYGRFDAATLVTPNRTSRAARVLTLVFSRVDNAPDRDAIRRSYGSVKQVGDQTVRTLFVVGRSASRAVDQAVLAEGARFGDILQFDFADTYLNLTLKTVLGLRWASRGEGGGGLRAEYVLKADEDVLVNYDHLLVALRGHASSRPLYAGFVWSGARPFRDPANKYYVSTEEYARESYPDYAAGPCYVMSADAARLVVERAPTLPFLSMEDVFVGICADLAGVKVTSIPGFGNELEGAYDYCKFQSMIAVHGVKADWKERYWLDRAAKSGHGGRPNC